MNAIRTLSLLVLAAVAAPVQADLLVRVDCADRKLPNQAVVGAALGIANFDQAYQARARLANIVNRACKGSPDGRVDLVLQPAARPGRAPAIVALNR